MAGSGTRLKLIEAAGYARPMVSTRIGAEGLAFRDGAEILLRETDEAIAGACVELLRDDGACLRLGAQAREAMGRLYDSDAIIGRIEGLVGVPVGTSLVLDLGAGQLAVVTVSRSEDASIGVEFEAPLVSDGAGGLVTRYRASPYALAAAARMVSASAPQFLEVEVRKRA